MTDRRGADGPPEIRSSEGGGNEDAGSPITDGASSVDPSADDGRAGFGYGLAPLWSWNARATRERTRQGVEWLDEVGFDGFFVHPRPGVRQKVYGHEWMERVWDAVDAAGERGMDVWLYDEDSFPSGFAGGQLLDDHPEYRARGLRYERADDWDDLPHDALAAADLARTFALGEAVDERGYRRVDGPVDGADAYLAFRLEYAPDSGRFNGGAYVDTRDPAAVEAFLETAYEPYAEYFGEQFGDRVVGVFTDEPKGTHGLDGPALDWSAALAEGFRADHGYDVRERLPALVADTPDAASVRFDYYDTCNRLFVESYTERIDDWCARRGLQFTGHLMEHEWPDLSGAAAYVPHLAAMGTPGIDCLFRPGTGRSQVGNERMLAELDAVGHQFDRRRMCETWGGMGWSADEGHLRRMLDWLLAGGVDFVVPHLVHYGLEGSGKRDWPPSYGEHSPGTAALAPLFDYAATVAEWLDAGEKCADVAVVHPATTVWTAATPGEPDDDVRELGDAFESFVAALRAAGVGFDLVDETVLRDEGRVDGDRLVVGEVDYATVVLPDAVGCLRATTVATLASFAAAGGDLRAAPDASVERVDGDAVTDPLAGAVERAPSTGALVEALAERDPLSVSVSTPAGGTRDDGGEGSGSDDGAPPDPGAVHTRLVRSGDEYRCFAVNRTGDPLRVTLRVDPPANRVERIRAVDAYQHVERVDRGVDGDAAVAVRLAPYASVSTTFALDGAAPSSVGREESERESAAEEASGARPASATGAVDDVPDRVPAENLTVEARDSNAAVLDFVDLTVGDAREEGVYVLDAAERVYDAHAIDATTDLFDGRRYWTLVREGEKRRREPGFEAVYRFDVAPELVGEALAVAVERPGPFEVTLNGAPLSFDGWWLDRGFRRADAAAHVVAGENELRVAAPRASVEHALEPAYVVADAAVDRSDPACPALEPAGALAPGSVTDQGYPFYAGALACRGTVAYDPDWGPCRLVADVDGLAATAALNGTHVGPVGQPYHDRDVSGALSAGENDLAVVVHVAPRNVVGPLHHPETPAEAGLAHPGMFARGEPFSRPHVLEPAGLHSVGIEPLGEE